MLLIDLARKSHCHYCDLQCYNSYCLFIGVNKVQVLIIILMLLFFFVYPSWGILQRKIALKGVTIYLDQTPLTFWGSVGFLYFCGVAFPCIMLKLPFAGIFMPIMIIFAIVYTVVYFLKL